MGRHRGGKRGGIMGWGRGNGDMGGVAMGWRRGKGDVGRGVMVVDPLGDVNGVNGVTMG